MNAKRRAKDRRGHNLMQDKEYRCNRRIRPCRRLDSISAEWVSMDTVSRHPVIWQMFQKLGYAR
jgi:hypothetical protein